MEQGEFDALYTREYPRLVGALTVVCGDRSEAADCVQEAFVRAWENRGKLGEDAGGWVRVVATRVAISRWRKTRNAVLAWTKDAARRDLGRGGDPAGEASIAWQGRAWHALRELPSAQRETLAMFYVLDMPVAEIAQLMGVAVGTVKARLSRGRQAMALALTSTIEGAAADVDEGGDGQAGDIAGRPSPGIELREAH